MTPCYHFHWLYYCIHNLVKHSFIFSGHLEAKEQAVNTTLTVYHLSLSNIIILNFYGDCLFILPNRPAATLQVLCGVYVSVHKYSVANGNLIFTFFLSSVLDKLSTCQMLRYVHLLVDTFFFPSSALVACRSGNRINKNRVCGPENELQWAKKNAANAL